MTIVPNACVSYHEERKVEKVHPISSRQCDRKQEPMGKYSERSKEYTAKYTKEHLDEIKLRVPKGRKAYYQEAAAAAGLSLNQFAAQAMDEKIERKSQ